ncbi:hypothetical protein TSUD_388950 [Trifolium subterraneum]|uniref:Uncharacterized protein n=1 Tax=Trifolium subterraneum TaxID=3900 RepID=A0A2Z6MF89_TRISU|nr:hypothetical protein TSUD_388950 [Trifolium subterraneum]
MCKVAFELGKSCLFPLPPYHYDFGFLDAELRLDFDFKLVLKNTKGSVRDDMDKIPGEFGIVERKIANNWMSRVVGAKYLTKFHGGL